MLILFIISFEVSNYYKNLVLFWYLNLHINFIKYLRQCNYLIIALYPFPFNSATIASAFFLSLNAPTCT